MLERIRKLIERYSRISAEHSTAATMNDEFSKGVCSVVDGVVSDLKKVEVEMSKLKLFKCTFEVDTGVNYNKKVKYLFANNESECYDILSRSKKICPCHDDTVINLVVEEADVEYGLIMQLLKSSLENKF